MSEQKKIVVIAKNEHKILLPNKTSKNQKPFKGELDDRYIYYQNRHDDYIPDIY